MTDHLSIGEVLSLLQDEFPDVTISKIRFLESEGLISPERAPSGYRRYAQHDVDRLRYILRVQRDHYLPLKVIREHLEMMDRGDEPPSMEAPPPTPAAVEVEPVAEPRSRQQGQPRKAIRLSRRELLAASGISDG